MGHGVTPPTRFPRVATSENALWPGAPTGGMEWRLFATLAESAGDDTVEVEIDGEATLREAFDALLESHPDLEPEVLDGDERLYDHVRLLVDGRDPFNEEGWATTVDEGSELALFPPVSGG